MLTRHNLNKCLRRLVSCAFVTLAFAPTGSVMADEPDQSLRAADTEPVYELEDFTVTAFRREYAEFSTDTGLGLQADPKKVPLTMISIPIDILDDQQVNNVEDALRNASGVTKFKQGNGGEEKFSIRGFDASQSIYKDGARLNNSFNATNIATTETANIERYDVLKGPAAILYGQGEPGGVINYITKKPQFTPYGQVEGIVGSYDFYRGEIDITGPVGGPDSAFAYRIVASYEDSEANRDFIFRERLLIAPSLSWRLTADTLLTAQYEYIEDEYTQDRGQVLDGDNVIGYRYSGRLENQQFFGVPGFNDRTESEYHRASVLLNHNFSENSRFSLNASATRVDKTLYDSSPSFADFATLRVVAPNGDVVIRPRGQGGDGDSDNITARHEYTWEQNGRLTHQFLFGADYEALRNDTKIYSVNTPAILYNVETGIYTGIPAGGVQFTGSSQGTVTNTRQYGAIVQDLISLDDRWHLLLGGRFTRFEDREADVETDEFSPRTGLVFRATDAVSLYASWARGFVPTTATGFNPSTGNGIGGDVLDPELTEQFEVGVKWGLLSDRLQLNAAVFDLRKKDIVGTDPDSTVFPAAEQWSANLGETRTRGFDLQLVGQVNPSLRIIAGYAYLDNQLLEVEVSIAGQEDNRLPGIPEHSFNLWGVYEFMEGTFEGLGLGLGIFGQTDTYVSTENRSEYDGYIQLDAVVYYKRDNWKFQVNFKNLTDEEFNLAQAGTTSDAFGAIRVGTGTPATVNASLSFEF